MATGKIRTVSLGVTTSDFFSSAGLIDVYGFFGKVAGGFSNTGNISATTYFGLESASFSNTGTSGGLGSTGHVYIKTTGAFTNGVNRTIKAEQIDVRAGSVANAGLISANNVVNIADVAGAISNAVTGEIYSKTIALVAGTSFRNDGKIGTKAVLTVPVALGYDLGTADLVHISAGTTLDNYGQIAGKTTRLIAQGNITLRDGSTLRAANLLGLKSVAGGVTNFGDVSAANLSSEAAGLFDNQGRLAVTDTLSVTAGGFRNLNGSLRADGSARAATIQAKDIVLDIVGQVGSGLIDVSNSGSMIATNGIYVDAEKSGFSNTGTLSAVTLAC
jgi:hypothetical protein